jgi:hypothetical protein
MTSLTHEISYYPMFLPNVDGLAIQSEQLAASGPQPINRANIA